ncbi:MAG: DNA-binding domain-containing protein [Rhodobacter sp.]|nr:DNA-binding domain-containing protein [Rhodobacter sp.]
MMGGQTAFTRALLDPALAAPEGLVNPDGAPATKRFDVYRNNVAVSLIEALETGFPVICKLVGEAFFKAMAGIYLRRFPPTSQLMMFYGQDMPAFLTGFEPVQHLQYLPDVARLELALRACYHAADATPIAPETLQDMPADRLMAARFEFAPAMALIRSRWPVHGIWRMNMEDGAPQPGNAGENVLLTRPEYDPQLTTLAPGGGTFVAALMNGKAFGESLDAATAQVPDFDLTATLGVLFAGAAITRLNED